MEKKFPKKIKKVEFQGSCSWPNSFQFQKVCLGLFSLSLDGTILSPDEPTRFSHFDF
jgi:hypothetical protein